VFVSVHDPAHMDEAQTELTALLRDRHVIRRAIRADDFAVQNTAKLLTVEREMGESLTAVTTAIAGVALFAGAVGILGLMLLAVRERTTEIGLRMAVGATPGDIRLQFLCESMLLVAVGAATGIALALPVALVVTIETGWPIGMPVNALVISIAIAVFGGTALGALPAGRAARIAPIDALLAR
jgi:putative ABC transport system permease protein